MMMLKKFLAKTEETKYLYIDYDFTVSSSNENIIANQIIPKYMIETIVFVKVYDTNYCKLVDRTCLYIKNKKAPIELNNCEIKFITENELINILQKRCKKLYNNGM